MEKLFQILLFIIFFAGIGKSQPLPCGADPKMTSTCEDACIICDIDGFTGINNSTIQGFAPPGFCTGQVHHMQWIAFIAGTTNITIEFSVFNCRGSNGLEVGIYEAEECKNFKLVTECDTDIDENSKRIFKNIVPLTIGQYYYWVMDGSNNDVCDYSIKVLDGSTKVDPLEIPGNFEIPDTICAEDELLLSTPGIIGATIYDWKINDVLVSSKIEYTHKFNNSGIYNICLNARNVCDEAPPACKKVIVRPQPRSTIKREVCFGQCLEYEGFDFCTSGNYDITLKTDKGCDSIVTLELTVKDEIISNKSVNLCDGDTLKIGDYAFNSAGNFTAYILDAAGCKIKVIVEIKIIQCNITGLISSESVTCFRANDGILKLKILNGTPILNYKWAKLESNEEGQGIITNLEEELIISGLSEGTYVIEITDVLNNVRVFNTFLSQPMVLKINAEIAQYNGFDLLCYGGSNGKINTNVSGGNAGYNYIWNNGNTTPNISDLKAGIYSLTVTDAKACREVFKYEIKQPDSLIISNKFFDPNCSGETTGRIINEASGGVFPYLYSLNGSEYSDVFSFDQLSSGYYTLAVKDLNGCITSLDYFLNDIKIPNLIYKDSYEIELGDLIEFSINSSLEQNKINWIPNTVACDSCLITLVLPLNDLTYVANVTSEDGCTRSAFINVKVNKNRSFITSNIISANEDGKNDVPFIYGGNDVASVLLYEIFDRWGSKVFSESNIPKGMSPLKFEGKFNERELASGIYTWTATVLYIDDVVIKYSGSMTILR